MCRNLFSCRTDTGTVVVTDPGNLAQSIINMSDNIVHTSSTATSTAQNFAETVKIYQQYKKYYDALKSVNNLVKDARKVSEIILMVGDVSEIYVTNSRRCWVTRTFSRRTGCHRFRLYQTSGREQRGVAGPQAGNQRQHPFHDRQGPYGRGG